MDRGHRLYSQLITQLSKVFDVVGRVIYVHDLPLPELLTNSKGVVTINSTVGISALIHGKPVKVMGDAFYDIDGITFNLKLNNFWLVDSAPKRELLKAFSRHLIENLQVNASFYRKNFNDKKGAE
jgi:capsular polysaccharide export protein